MADAVAQPDEVTKLSPAGVPVVSQVQDLRIATVFPSEGTARLLIFKGPALISGSAPFEFPTSANFGAAWVERIEISSSSRFVESGNPAAQVFTTTALFNSEVNGFLPS